MRICDLLTLMGRFSVGADNVSAAERGIFLQYLNLAHLELYQETANFNADLAIRESRTTAPQTGAATLSRTPYAVNSVYEAAPPGMLHQKLVPLSLADLADQELALAPPGRPRGYFLQKNVLRLIPAPLAPASVIVWHVPQPSPLEEHTAEGDIPYPLAYHPVLADGALCCLFQEEGGFKSAQKENEAKRRWETGKSRLLSYLYGSSPQGLSTFRNA